VFIRGDHERCGRQWLGYLRYLAPQAIRSPLFCDNYLPPFIIAFNDLQMAVLDSSTRNRGTYTWDRFRAMRGQFLDVLPRLEGASWLLTHAPLWGYGQTEAGATDLVTLETIQREAFGAMLPRAMSAVISGDLHFAQMVSMAGMPTQITIGNGGAAAYTTPVGHADGVAVGNSVLGDVFGNDAFGFGLIDRSSDTPRLTLFDRNGVLVATCVVPAGARSCAME
ncbi:MAG: hypothetical protein ACTSWI_05130, partial [Alphaproteobacteria bacterium]